MAPRRSDLGLPLLAVDRDHGYPRCLPFRYEWLMLRVQKKGNTKWVCVVCNRRQYVLHVHARGYCAAD